MRKGVRDAREGIVNQKQSENENEKESEVGRYAE